MAILGLGEAELLVILVIFILLFGATAIPKLARSLGKAKGEFSRAKQEFSAAAAQAEGGPSDGAGEAQVRQAARSLGIDDAGKTVEELRELIQKRVS